MITIVKKNKLLFLMFVLVVLIFGMFHIINIFRHGYELYNPVPVVNGYISSLDEAHYPPGFRDVIDGHYIVKSPQLKEYKENANHIDILPYFVLGFPAAMLGGGVKEIFIISDFIFPAIGFVVLYFLMRRVYSLRKDLSILFALLISIFQSFTVFVLGLFNLSSFNFTTAVDSLGQGKLYAPELVFIPFILAIITLYYSFKKEGYLYPALTVVLGTILVYSYIFYSTFYWATFALLSLYMLFINRNSAFPVLKKILFIVVPSVILSIPFILEFLAFKNLEAYPEMLLRVGVETGRFIHLPIIFAAISILFLMLAYKVMHNKDRFLFIFTAAMLISTIIWSNLQVLTGYNVQPFHWTYRISEILFFIVAAYILQEGYIQLKNSDKKGLALIGGRIIKPVFGFLVDKRVVSAAIIFFIIYGFGYSISAALRTGDAFVFDKDELELYKWLNENTPKDSVVLTLSIDQNIKISSYSHNNVYLANGLFSTWKTEEIIDRIAFLYNIYELPEDDLHGRVDVRNDAFRLDYINELYKGKRFSLDEFERYYFITYPFAWQFFYGRWDYQQQNPDNPDDIGYYFPSKFRNKLTEKFHNQSYTVYAHDYILVGPYEMEIADIRSLQERYDEIFSNDDFVLLIL